MDNDERQNYVEESFEGDVLYKLHKVRERDNKLNQSKKDKVFEEKGCLKCEVCDFNFSETYGELGEGFIECHHIEPLSNYTKRKKTSIQDLALVCSNCHRMLHKDISNLSIEKLKRKINKL